MAVQLENRGGGVFVAPGARIIDRSGRKRLAIGDDGFVSAMRNGTLVDKTALIADVLDSGYKATLFCRPRRFGKTLNMTMLKAYLEGPEAGGLAKDDAEELFQNTDVWEADGGAYRQYQGAYPVVHLSLRTAKGATWRETLSALRTTILAEYQRHDYLLKSNKLPDGEAAYLSSIMRGEASDNDYADSLIRLTRALRAHHGHDVVVLVDEYDAPVMAGHTYGYYDEVVGFLRRWLTGALKDGGEALAFACLTGVQRIAKESIFSDLNNLYVSTPLDDDFDERFGFTDAEVEALATYLGHPDCMPEAREWYDGYRFGTQDVYNPWSVISYLNKGCRPGTYWGNTSGNSVLGELVSRADAETLDDVYALLEPGGTVSVRLDLGVVFPDLGIREGALWSMLYLAGYLTTNDTEDPASRRRRRRLRVPDREVAELFLDEIVDRFSIEAGGSDDLYDLQDALVEGDAPTFGRKLGEIVRDHASSFDLTRESEAHALLLGLLMGTSGYMCTSNREAGYGRYDIQLRPDPTMRGMGPRPLVTVEVKFARDADDVALASLAREALDQIAARGYDADLPEYADGRLRWGVAFSGKRVSCVCERA